MHLLVAGTGPELDSLQKQAEEIGVHDRINWLGVQRDIPELMEAVDVFCLTSIVEGLPVALIESQAAGLPSVVSSVVTSRAAVVDGLVRFVPVDDPAPRGSTLDSRQECASQDQVVKGALTDAGYSIEQSLVHALGNA